MPTPNVELLEVIEKPGLAEVAVSEKLAPNCRYAAVKYDDPPSNGWSATQCAPVYTDGITESSSLTTFAHTDTKPVPAVGMFVMAPPNCDLAAVLMLALPTSNSAAHPNGASESATRVTSRCV